MFATPIAYILIAFVASVSVITAGYFVHCGVARLAARRSD